jgi:predicted TIM-barrel fold metal-dependent hydrolase
MAREGFRIIDCHHHVGSVPSLMAATADSGPVRFTNNLTWRDDPNEVAARVAIMDANGVDASVVIPTHEYLRPDGHADTSAVNDAIAAYRDRLPDRFVAAVGIVEPLHGDASLPELARIRNDLGLVGVSFHTRFQGVSTDSPLVKRLIVEAAEVGLVPFVHSYADAADEAPWKIVELAEAVPDTTIVVLDGFSGFERTKEITRAAADAPNLVFDTSLVYSFDFVEHFIARFGHERVVFGTDMYSVPLAYRRSYPLEQLLVSSLTDDAKTAILSTNITRILNLPV